MKPWLYTSKLSQLTIKGLNYFTYSLKIRQGITTPEFSCLFAFTSVSYIRVPERIQN